AYAASPHTHFVACRYGLLLSVQIWNAGRCVDTPAPSSPWATWRPAGSRVAAWHVVLWRSAVLPLASLRLAEVPSASSLHLAVLPLEVSPSVEVRLGPQPSAAAAGACARSAVAPSEVMRSPAHTRIQSGSA